MSIKLCTHRLTFNLNALPHRWSNSICALIFSFLIFVVSVAAQSATASLSGTIVDANNQSVVNANITLRNVATNFERRIVTNDDGVFNFSDLPAARYQLAASANGFSETQIENLELNVNDRRSLRIELSVVGVGASINVVDSNAIQVTPEIATTVNRAFVENMPLNGRSFQNLIALTPGVVQTPASGFSPGQFSVNGQRTTSNYFTVDGVSANFGISVDAGLSRAEDGALPAFSAAGGTNSLVSVDALQEFKIQTSTYAAEFGRQPGGQIQILTRSGSNDVTFTLFEYLRNEKLDANDFFANANGLERAPVRQNDFGGVFGAPVFLPRFGEGGGKPYLSGRDRTFVFFSYEGLRLRQPRFSSEAYPTLEARAQAAPEARFLLDALPIPNREDLGDGTGRFAASYTDPSRLDATSVRLDHNFNSRATLFGRFNYAPSSLQSRGDTNTFNYALNNITRFRTVNKTLTVGSTQVMSTRATNEARFNFSRFDGRSDSFLDTLGGAIVPDNGLLFPSFASVSNANVAILPLDFDGFTIGANADNRQHQINITDNFSYLAGNHQLKFGADFRRLQPQLRAPVYNQLGIFLGLAGIPEADGAGGLQSGIAFQTVVSAFEDLRLRSDNLSLYAQDTWRASRRLSLSYGVRYERNSSPQSVNQNPLYTLRGLNDLATAQLAPAGTEIFETLTGFAPRIGASLLLNENPGRETVVRGGAGIFYDLPLGFLSDAALNPPYRRTSRLDFLPFPLPEVLANAPALSLQPPFDAAAGFDDDFKLPRTYQFNFAVEQSLGASRTVSAAYVGALGRNLLRTENVFNVNPDINRVIASRSIGASDYHALQVQFNQRLARGLQVLASHTYAHAIDNGSTNTTFLASTAIDDLQLNRGSSDFDIRHAFNAAATYDVPRFTENRFVNAVFGGLAIDSLLRLQTALPVNLFVRQVTPFGNIDFRPNLVGNQPLYLEDADLPGGRRFNPQAFTFGLNQQTQGTLGRNVLRGFPLRQLDVALRRRFALGERLNLQLRADVFNVTNTPNFANPNGFLGRPRGAAFQANPFFGIADQSFNNGLGGGGSNGGQNPLYSVGGARSIQLGLKLQF